MLLAVSGCAEPPDPPLEVFWPVPAFELTDQRGRAVSNDDLLGHVWVADFIFTRCPGICPRLSRNMKALQDDLAGQPWARDIELISFSLDPEHDSVEGLADYAAELGVDPQRWRLLTGVEQETMWAISQDGFKLTAQANPANPANPIMHSGRFVLVDRAGVIRGFYDGLNQQGLAQLKGDLRRLAAADG